MGKWNRVKKYLEIGLGIFSFIMMIFVFVIVKNMNPQEGKTVFGYRLFMVLSDSMKPKFQAGDVVVVKKVNPKTLKENDIITFYTDYRVIVTHKIHEVTNIDGKQAFITKGLNVTATDDDPVLLDEVIGKYAFKITKLGYVIRFMKSPLGFGCFVFLPFMLMIFFQGQHFYQALKAYHQAELTDQLQQLEAERLKNQQIEQELLRLKQQLNPTQRVE